MRVVRLIDKVFLSREIMARGKAGSPLARVKQTFRCLFGVGLKSVRGGRRGMVYQGTGGHARFLSLLHGTVFRRDGGGNCLWVECLSVVIENMMCLLPWLVYVCLPGFTSSVS